jgi:hypothetical protein
LGALLDDAEIRAGFVATGMAGDLESLLPRRPGELPRRNESRVVGRENLFDGIYRGEMTQNPDPDSMPFELGLRRQGDKVYGYYTFGLGSGTLVGSVVGNKLHFNWEWASNYGHGLLEGQIDRSFTGTWGHRDANSGAGTWTGRPSRQENSTLESD